jgi:hypothetical protein
MASPFSMGRYSSISQKERKIGAKVYLQGLTKLLYCVRV